MIVRRLNDGWEGLAPAKINLFLEILGRRPDGYHELETLMVAIDLRDTLRVVDDPSGPITLRCDDPSLPLGSENLVVRAAERLKAFAGIDRGASIELQKVIPAQAGLAGGSSDAAATLVLLDRVWNLDTPHHHLETIAAEIGSDVAFFLANSAAICRGRGERVEPLKTGGSWHGVLICPPFGVSTPAVYHRLTLSGPTRPIDAAVDALKQGDVAALGRALHNRLQPVAEAIEPRLVPIRQALESLGSLLEGSLMSGSGSAYFGLCRDEGAAGHAARHLGGLGLGRVQAVTGRL